MKTILLICFTLLLAITSVFANQKPAPYSLMVKWATVEASNEIQNAIYIWPWVKYPGAYSFTKGMTIAELVKRAGGFIKDERLKEIPSLYVYPDRISVFRSSENDPDPIKPIFEYSLNWSEPEGNISECNFELKPGDLIAVSFN